MDAGDVTCRPAVATDRRWLRGFDAGVHAPTDVAGFIHRAAMDRYLGRTQEDDFRLLVVEGAGRNLGVAAHERNWRIVDHEGDVLPGTELVVIALEVSVQNTRCAGGEPTIAVVLDHVLRDIDRCARGPWLFMFAHPDNPHGTQLCRRLGAKGIGQQPGGYIAYSLGRP